MQISGSQIAQLTAILTGGGFKRAKDKETAAKRFRDEATKVGIDPEKALGMPFDQAKAHVEHMAKLAKSAPEAAPAARVKAIREKAAKMVEKAPPAHKAAKPARKAHLEKPVRIPSKRELVAQLLSRPKGATRQEILDATGWPAVSVQSMAKASSLTLRQEKEGRSFRYYGKAA